MIKNKVMNDYRLVHAILSGTIRFRKVKVKIDEVCKITDETID